MNNTVIGSSNIRDLPKPAFISWLIEETDVLIAGVSMRCFRIEGRIDDKILQEWALHIRRHYVRDDELTNYVNCYEVPIEQHLREDCIPNVPRIRGGDFAEIVISDLIQFIERYEVPRYKQHGREDKNRSGHGTDVIAYKLSDPKIPSENDELLAVEVKSRSASTDLKGAITEAAEDSLKDRSRTAMTLAYYAERSLRACDTRTSQELKRFLHASEHPFKETFAIGAVAGLVNAQRHLANKSASDLMIRHDTKIFVIHGAKLMELVNNVYNRCVQ